LEPTPAQSADPFYPTESPLDDDQDLNPVRGALGLAQGRIKLAANFDLILGVTPHG